MRQLDVCTLEKPSKAVVAYQSRQSPLSAERNIELPVDLAVLAHTRIVSRYEVEGEVISAPQAQLLGHLEEASGVGIEGSEEVEAGMWVRSVHHPGRDGLPGTLRRRTEKVVACADGKLKA